VIDVNTGKFTGSGGNLEETVTRNNLEAAEEVVRQLRLRDIGGIIVVDFIDMVLETNRDLVLRRLTECLGRDRTRHQVAEVTSLGLVQMTRKRLGTGLLEAFSQPCEECNGRGVLISSEPVLAAGAGTSSGRRSGSNGKRQRGSTRRAAGSSGASAPAGKNPEEEKKTADRIAALSMIHEKASKTVEASTEPGVAAVEEVEDAESSDRETAAHTSNGTGPAEAAPSGTGGAPRRRAASRPAGPPPAGE
jgi:ribonuclease E